MLCVGLDPERERIPLHLHGSSDAIREFCTRIVDATAPFACAFKPQIAHFASQRAEGALEQVCDHIRRNHPAHILILDAKRGDIGSTAEHYAREAFDRYGADAVTVNPYLGTDAVEPFLRRSGKGVLVLCRTSNPGGADFQSLPVDGAPLFTHVARRVAREWSTLGEVGLVVGATFPDEVRIVRDIVGDLPLLVPGVGAQGGDLRAAIVAGRTRAGSGLIVNSSRAILYAGGGEDFTDVAAAVAAATRDEIRAAALA